MSYTFEEMVERMLEHLDMDELISVLNITPEDILDRFEDRIMRNYENIEEHI